MALLQRDRSEAELLRTWLLSAGHLCSWHACGYDFVRALPRVRFDVVVLDWNVRSATGEVPLKYIRANLQSQVPVVFVSAADEEAAIVSAFKEGADDYIVKPVRRMELLARLEAIARRSRRDLPRHTPVIDKGALRLHCQDRIAFRDGQPIALTAKDFDLAALFLSNAGRLLTRAEIHEAVWGLAAVFDSRTIDTHVSRLRARLGLTPDFGWRLTAVYGHGYRLDQVAIPPELMDKIPRAASTARGRLTRLAA